MADNIAVTAGSGTTVSTEEVTTLNGNVVSAQHVQRVGNAFVTGNGEARDADLGAGNVGSATQRMTLANNDPIMAKLDAIQTAAEASQAALEAIEPQLPQSALLDTSALTRALVDISTATTTEIVAADADQQINVHSVNLIILGAQVLTIKKGTTVIDKYEFGTGGGSIFIERSEDPWWETGTNQALNFTTTTTAHVVGRVGYRKP